MTTKATKSVQGDYGAAIRDNNSVASMRTAIWHTFQHRNGNHQNCQDWCTSENADKHIRDLDRRFHGIGPVKVRELAYEFAKRNQISKMPEKWDETQRAGADWLKGFMERNRLSCRKPEATSLGRSTAFNKTTVSKFFDNISDVYSRYGFTRQSIYNLDESGFTTVQRPSTVISTVGQKQVGAVTSAERGLLVTMVAAVSASGNSATILHISKSPNESSILEWSTSRSVWLCLQNGLD